MIGPRLSKLYCHIIPNEQCFPVVIIAQKIIPNLFFLSMQQDTDIGYSNQVTLEFFLKYFLELAC